MVARIVPAHIAHMASTAQPCGEKQLFPGDEVAAVCSLQVGDPHPDRWHHNGINSRRWRRVGRDVEAMVQPGSPPLRYAPTSHEEQAMLDARR